MEKKLYTDIVGLVQNEDGTGTYGKFEFCEVKADKDGVYLDIRGEGETFVGVMLNADKAEQLIQMLVRGIEEHCIEEHNALVR